LEKQRDYLVTVIENIKGYSQKYIGVAKEKMQEYVGSARASAIFMNFGRAIIKSDKLYGLVPEDEHKGARAFAEKAKETWKEEERRSMAGKEKELLEKKSAQSKRQSKDDFEMER
jgi:hypothetical protein